MKRTWNIDSSQLKEVGETGTESSSCVSTDHSSTTKIHKREPNPPNLSNRLYFTKISGHPHRFNTNALSLRELLEAISPVASIHFNFMVDFPWLFAQYPRRCSMSPMTIIVGESNGTSQAEIRADAKKCAFENLSVGRARLPIPFGTHHTKLSIFESDSEQIHVIISTANLLQNDWESKTQAFYHCKANIVS
ncbi:unnamed protein product [Anisakis simplex]|uniref:Probable tyrosyl-DNA phosphodiesterase (inferred by orthology to a C. elegans protein) n=1 Tax=Anisakis simplex TaxID=6269 RepID=A0A0M3J979_ANISI|nr:unnamed protein product [Anisakis simplex]